MDMVSLLIVFIIIAACIFAFCAWVIATAEVLLDEREFPEDIQ